MRSAGVALPKGLARWIPTIDQFPTITSVAEPDHGVMMQLPSPGTMLEFFRGFTVRDNEEWHMCQETRHGGRLKDIPPRASVFWPIAASCSNRDRILRGQFSLLETMDF